MTFSDWLMSCQAWLPRARYSQWARCKYWRPAVYFLYKMACLKSFYLKYCQTHSTGISIWHKDRCRSYLLVQNFEVIWWEATLLSLSQNTGVYNIVLARSRTRQNFELVHIIGPVQNFGPPARNFGTLRAEFAWREWRKTLGGHVANWAGLSGFSPRENKISHTFFIDCINKYFKVSNAHNSDDCHGVFNGGMLNKGWSFLRSRFDCLGLMRFFHG